MGILENVCVERTSVPDTDRIPPETAVFAGPPPAGTQEVFVQIEPLSVVPLKSSSGPDASCTSPPEVLVTVVPFRIPVLKSATVVCVQTPMVVNDQESGAMVLL